MIRPADLQLGNFIYVFGKAEFVTGITPMANGKFFINHSACFQENNPISDDILFDADPIPVTVEWLTALKIQYYDYPEHIQFVHEAQNYAKWVYQADFQPDFDLVVNINNAVSPL